MTWLLRSPVGLALLLVTAGPVSVGSREVAAPACDCTHLAALQAELRNAIKLQTAFRNKIQELRGMNTPTSLTELQRFAAGEARRGLERVPGYTGPSEVDYESWGQQNITVAQGNSTSKLCGMTQTAQQQLAAAEQGSACTGIGKALRAHEAHHMNMCAKIGFFAYMAVHGADRAQEEVEAYGAQIAVLRSEIAGVLERAKLRVELEQTTRVQMPPNPAYTAINLKNDGKLLTTPPPTISGDNIHFDGRGEQSMNGSIEGNCRFAKGLPFTLPAVGSVDTDGLTARVQFRVEGTVPQLSMTCEIGGGKGSGFSMPVPVGPNAGLPAPVTLPLRDKAEVTHDMANTMAASVMAGSGVSISGKTKIRLVLDCPSRP